jgi:predicted RND superfamily exporter protein
LTTVTGFLEQKLQQEILEKIEKVLEKDLLRRVRLYLKIVYLLTEKGYFDITIPDKIKQTKKTVARLLAKKEASRIYNSSITIFSSSSNKADWEAIKEYTILLVKY